MSRQVKLRRGTAAQHSSFTGVEGEVTVNTTGKELRVHDGGTAGGVKVARADGSNATGTWPVDVSGNANTATFIATTVPINKGGTGATGAAGARTNLGVAERGANTDITSLRQSTSIAASGVIAPDSVGFRGLPVNTRTGSYELLLNDAAKLIDINSGTLTIPSNASEQFPVGTVIAIYNNAASSRTLAINSDTLRLAGTALTGSRTLAQFSVATIAKVGVTTWVVSGAGVS